LTPQLHAGPTPAALARTSLDAACHELDEAVRGLGEAAGDTVMANADLVSLLLRVVSARRQLVDVESETSSHGLLASPR
jgi:hypothetical protein